MKRCLGAVWLVLAFLLTACPSSEPIEVDDPENDPRIANFAADPSSGEAPLETTFSWQISGPNGDVLNCTLDFGDGSDAAEIENCTSSSTQTHTYQEEGSYTANLTVESGGGESVSSMATVSVGSNPPPPAPPGDDGELEECTPETVDSNNNVKENACGLTLGQRYQGKLEAPDDVDFYAFETTQAGVVEALIASTPPNLSVEFQLQDQNGAELDSETLRGEGSHTFYALEEAGRYFLRVESTSFGDDTSSDPYDILVKLDTSDTNELNETKETATPIAFGEGIVAQGDAYGYNYSAAVPDKDIYRLDTGAEAGVANLILSNVPESGLRMRILDGNGEEVDDDTAFSSGNTLNYGIIVTSQTLFLEVSARQGIGSSAPYELRASLDTSDVFEPNNSLQNPSPIGLGQSLQADINGGIYTSPRRYKADDDFYQIEPQPDQAVRVVLSSVPDALGVTLTVYDANKVEIDSGFVLLTSASRSLILDIAAERNPAFVSVQYRNGETTTEPYELSVNVLE